MDKVQKGNEPIVSATSTKLLLFLLLIWGENYRRLKNRTWKYEERNERS